MRNLLFAVSLMLAFVVGWKLGVATVQPEETAMKGLLGRVVALGD